MKPFRSLQTSCLACLGRWSKPGTRSWLVERELRYGGYVTGLKRYRISELDGRDLRWDRHGMTGGDRMNPRRHNYGGLYAKYLGPFVESGAPVTVVEVGILQGTGLAIWSDLFPNGRVVGLDIDLTHFESNLGLLCAWERSKPKIMKSIYSTVSKTIADTSPTSFKRPRWTS